MRASARKSFGAWLLAGTMAASLGACATPQTAEQTVASVADTALSAEEARVQSLLAQMSLERKIAQLIQPQINSFTAADMERYRFGSYLNGGNGGPGGEEFAPAKDWLALADEMWEASTKPLPGGEPAIPVMWGTDAVHGHTNIVGATIFPHNMALGATRDADLVRRIGAATAVEIEVTGIDWNFSPTVAVARDDRWGRTYESYSEDPKLVAKMGAALVEGLQGAKSSDAFLGDGHVIATAKHFFGDGGTDQGVDQGEVNGDIDALKSIHAVPYPATIDAGVQTIMASFNSINGKKMHGNKALLTDVLRGELGFDGLVVGDWNGHGQVKGCTNDDCAQSIMAGLDIYMVPDDWKALHANLMAQVKDGTIPMQRIDEAVARVLRLKLRAGVLDAPKPSERANAGEYGKLGSARHRAIAREAVAKSQVVLKNNGVLPLKAGANVLVAGSAADSIAQASGGWTLTWQGGTELTNDYFPGATSIWAGLESAVTAGGGTATLSADGSFADKPDVAIVVFGEKPYAEFAGDRKDLAFRDEEGLKLLRELKAKGVPSVAVFLSGRPMWMNREINAADAFVASWLPGGEGAGVADILIGAEPATGKLSFSWPAKCEGEPLNSSNGALFAFGYGRSLTDISPLAMLDENCAALAGGPSRGLFGSGRLADGVIANAGEGALPNLVGVAGGITAIGYDKDAQEDARAISFAPGSSLVFTQSGSDTGAYRITYEVAKKPSAPVHLINGEKRTDISRELLVAEGKGWREMVITPACAGELGNALGFGSDSAFTFRIATITRFDAEEGADCSF